MSVTDENEFLNDLEEQIVDLIEDGYGRAAIAEQLGLGQSTVRDVIRRLCDEFRCPTKDLPREIRKEKP